MLTIRNLCKTYPDRDQPALHDLSLSVDAGVVALLGHNGSGKSTLLRVLATLAAPDSGTISFGDYRYGDDPRPLRHGLGYLPQDLDLPLTMTPRKLLRYLAKLRDLQIGRAALDAQIDSLIDSLGLSARAHQPLAQLSGGQVRMIGVAQAVMHQPRLLLLDELTRGLDIDERQRVLRLIRAPRKTSAPTLTIFSTHIPEEAEQIADSVIVLAGGRALYAGRVDALLTQLRVPTMESAYLALQ